MHEQETLEIETQAGEIETQAGEHETQAGENETLECDEQADLVEELLIEEISIDGMCGVY